MVPLLRRLLHRGAQTMHDVHMGQTARYGYSVGTSRTGATRMKLRDAITLYAEWIRAIEIAYRDKVIDFLRYITGISQIEHHARKWIGEDLLERII